MVDPFVRKGYRFKGVASILESGPAYDKLLAFYKKRGRRALSGDRDDTSSDCAANRFASIDLGFTEDQVRDRWDRFFQSLRSRKPTSQRGE